MGNAAEYYGRMHHVQVMLHQMMLQQNRLRMAIGDSDEDDDDEDNGENLFNPLMFRRRRTMLTARRRVGAVANMVGNSASNPIDLMDDDEVVVTRPGAAAGQAASSAVPQVIDLQSDDR